jgi:hypothetical protein
MNGGGRVYDSCKFVEMRDRTVVKLFWTVRGNQIDVAAAIQFGKLNQGGWFAVGTSPNNNADGQGMVNADIVIGYVDRLGNGFGYMAGMTSTTQASPTIKNPFKPLNAKIGVSSVQEGSQTSDDLEVMEFTIDRALWGNGNPISLLVSYRSADALFDVTKAPVPNTLLQGSKHTDRIRIKNFDFDVASTCNELPPSLQPQEIKIINGVRQVDTFNLCPQFPSGVFDMSGVAGYKAVLSWEHLCDETLTNFTLVVQTTGWVGIGFKDSPPNAAAMVGADLMQFSANLQSLNGGTPGSVNAKPEAFKSNALRLGTVRSKLSGKELTVNFQRAWFAVDDKHASLSGENGLFLLLARHATTQALATKHNSAIEIPQALFLFGKNAPLPTLAPTLAPPTTGRPGTAPVVDPNPCVANAKDVFTNKVTAQSGAVPVTVTWTINCEKKTIKFAVSAESDGWVSFGLNGNAEMEGTDTYQTSVDAVGKVLVRNGAAADYGVTQDAIVAGATGTRDGKKLTVEFERPLAGSNGDASISFATPLVINVALGSDNTFTKKHATKGSTKKVVQFFTKNGDPLNPPKPATPARTTLAGGNTLANDPCKGDKLSNSVSLKFTNGDPVDVKYVIDCAAQTIEFAVTGKSKGWLAIGFNTVPNKMGGTDVYQLGVVGGEFKVRNGHAEGRSLEEDNFIAGASGSFANGVVEGKFQRKLSTGDSVKDLDIKPGSKLVLVIARGPASFDAQHNDRITAADGIDLFEGGTVGAGGGAAPLVLIHGFLMLLAWTVLSVVGTFFARYLKDLGHAWYVAHRGMMSTAVLLTFIGFILITIHVGKDGLHYNSVHALLGVVVIMFSIAQPLIGILSNRWWSPNRNGTPVFPDVVHWWLGRLTILVGFVTSLLGVLLAAGGAVYAASGGMIVLLIWVVVVVVYTALGEKFVGAIHHNAAPFDQEPKKVDTKAWRNISFAILGAGTVAVIIVILLLAFTAPF